MESEERINVLLVDDYPENLTVLQSVLEDMNLNLVTASSGREALRRVLSEDFALILLDVRMPGLDGVETAHLIRGRERSRHTPIIFLTAHAAPEEQVFKAYQSGAVDYIFKPFIPEVLKSKVAVFVDLFKKTQELRNMNEELGRKAHELEIAEEKYRSIFERASEGIFQTDPTGRRYVTANPAMARILGYDSAQELIEQVHDLNREVYTDLAARTNFRNRVGVHNTVHDFESQAIRKDGRTIWVCETTKAMRDSVGNLIGYEGILQDVTERKTAQLEVAAKNRDLETLLYVTSHDLREPLRTIESFSMLVQERYAARLEDTGRDFLRRVILAARRLENLLNDILTLSRAQRVEPTRVEISAHDIVNEALRTLENKIRETNADVTVVEGLPKIRIDRMWATQAVYNLILNALKFTQEGESPQIEIAPYHANGEDSHVIGIVVRDRGPGIAPEHAERIFQLFQRAVGREVEGTGAGLAIVRQIAERHGGRAWAQPREGGGSEFIITFQSNEPGPRKVVPNGTSNDRHPPR